MFYLLDFIKAPFGPLSLATMLLLIGLALFWPGFRLSLFFVLSYAYIVKVTVK